MNQKEIQQKIIEKQKCGIVMPISSLDGCTEQHWAEVLEILRDIIEAAGFEANLVSNADDIGIIQKRIVQNLYENPIIVCDISGKNPNVMFELGMRLAFDKPTIIIKDDKTSYSFDTSPIEHITYPRDLRFSKIIDFKKSLSDKLSATYKNSATDPNFSTFLKHFGKFTVAKLETTEVSKDAYILEEIRDLRRLITNLTRFPRNDKLTMESDHKMSLMDCKRMFTFAIRRVLKELSLDKSKIELPEMEEEILRLAIKSGRLPECFNLASITCNERLRNSIAETYS